MGIFDNLVREKVEISDESAAEILGTADGEFVPESITVFPIEWEATAESNFGNLALNFESQEDYAQKTLDVLLNVVFPNFKIEKKGSGYAVNTTNNIAGVVKVKIEFEKGERFKNGAFVASFWVNIFSKNSPRSANRLRFVINATPK